MRNIRKSSLAFAVIISLLASMFFPTSLIAADSECLVFKLDKINSGHENYEMPIGDGSKVTFIIRPAETDSNRLYFEWNYPETYYEMTEFHVYQSRSDNPDHVVVVNTAGRPTGSTTIQKFNNINFIELYICPLLSINKTADEDAVVVGDTVHYIITVTNEGQVEFNNISVVDEMLGLDETIASLAKGETATLTGSYVTTADDIGSLYNKATATIGVISVSDDATVLVSAAPVPSLSVTKLASADTVVVGETVTYKIYVTNDGETDLTNVRVVDELLEIDQTIASLPIGAMELVTGSYVASEVGTLENTATATSGDLTDSDTVTVTVTSRPPDPEYGLSINKSADVESIQVGGTIHYTIRVENTGDTALSNVLVVDDLLGFSELITTLAPGAYVDYDQTDGLIYLTSIADLATEDDTVVNTAYAEADQHERVTDTVTVSVYPEPEPGTGSLKVIKCWTEWEDRIYNSYPYPVSITQDVYDEEPDCNKPPTGMSFKFALYDSENKFVAEKTTDGQAPLLFDNLKPGYYTLFEVIPEGARYELCQRYLEARVSSLILDDSWPPEDHYYVGSGPIEENVTETVYAYNCEIPPDLIVNKELQNSSGTPLSSTGLSFQIRLTEVDRMPEGEGDIPPVTVGGRVYNIPISLGENELYGIAEGFYKVDEIVPAGATYNLISIDPGYVRVGCEPMMDYRVAEDSNGYFWDCWPDDVDIVNRLRSTTTSGGGGSTPTPTPEPEPEPEIIIPEPEVPLVVPEPEEEVIIEDEVPLALPKTGGTADGLLVLPALLTAAGYLVTRKRR